MPNHEEVYKNQAELYEKMISVQPDLSGIIREIRDFRKLDVVDLGAGTGRLSAFIAPEANSLIATDASESMLGRLEDKLSRLRADGCWRTVVADHRSLPIPDGSADLVVSGWSIGYLANSDQPGWRENLTRVLQEADRILRKDGTLVILETMGTGYESPYPPPFLHNYFRLLEEEYGFLHRWIRMDYQFASQAEAEELTGFFFGDELVQQIRDHQWVRVPECAGIWWKHKAGHR
ncbi:class I SAM-dependent methyltransferase [Paenibacillus sp. P26]|nr:class I SAM-dependent methyltransferase [Paenibacillus sp. P26]UUZ94488.1 class I SAM-dependent methyltransferase [Paenibacillus sp. P25]